MQWLTKIVRMRAAKRRLLIGAVAMLCYVRLGLLISTYARMTRRLDRRAQRLRRRGAGARGAGDAIGPDDVVWALNRAGRVVPGGRNCLLRAVTGKYLLARLGYSAILHIGVARSENRAFEAHAWLEWEERVLVGQMEDLNRFRTFPLFEKGLS
jgi:hypothetical protein